MELRDLESQDLVPGEDVEEELIAKQSEEKLTAKRKHWFTRPIFTCFPWCFYENGEPRSKFSFRSIFTPILSHPWALLFVIAAFIVIDCLYLWQFPPITWQGWFAIITTVFAFGIMASDVWSPTFVFIWLIMLYTVTDIATIEQALTGFCNSSVATIALLFCIAGTLEDNGLMYYISKYFLGTSKNLTITALRMTFGLLPLSGFINNTPIVAVLIPSCAKWAQQTGISASKLLMPLSFATILGGTLTNIGTSTNLVVVGLAKDQYPGVDIAFFDVGYPGLPCAILGCIYLVIVCRFLPARKNLGMEYLSKPLEFTFAVRAGSGIKKKTKVKDFRTLRGMFLFEIDRDGELIPAPPPETEIHKGDILKFTGDQETADLLYEIPGIEPAQKTVNMVSGKPSRRRIVEVVVSHKSPIVSLTPQESRFRSVYDAAIIAVARHGERIEQHVCDIVIQPEDILLVEASPTFVKKFCGDRKHFTTYNVLGVGLQGRKPNTIPLLICVAGITTMIILNIAEVEELFILAGFVFCGFIALGFQSWESALQKMQGAVLFQIAASFVLGTALSNTGVAKIIGDFLLEVFEVGGKLGVLYGCYITTAFFTAILTNAAAATVILPITQSFVDSGLVTPKACIIIVMLASSCDFMTSIGYQTNIMICAPGRYQFADFTKFGTPLTLITSVVGTICTNFFFN